MAHNEPKKSSINRRTFIQASTSLILATPLLITARKGAAQCSSDYRIVETGYGKVRGAVRENVATFLGIAYGAPTEGANRFLPPKPPRRWIGVCDALALGDQSPQLGSELPAWIDSSAQSEDCLRLNVWSPDTATPISKLAVMVWMHGGGFSYGSAGIPVYQGLNLAKTGNVVVVGVNHRLNVFGYNYVGQGGDDRFALSGNVGQLDLIAALQWVRDNVDRFGGNPDNVTIFGESGGGGKVSAIMAAPAAEGLFHKAIVQSGSGIRMLDEEVASRHAQAIYAYLNIRPGDVATLQQVPTAKLLEAAASRQTGEIRNALGFSPVADGRHLQGGVWESSAPQGTNHIPMIIGTTRDESVAFVGPRLASLPQEDAALAQLIRDESLLSRISPDEIPAVLRAYRNAMPNASRVELFVRVTTDTGFWRNALLQAERKLRAGSAPVYMYEFAWDTPCFDGLWSPHAGELPFLFNVLSYPSAWDGKDSAEARARADPPGDRFRLAIELGAAWANFARTGNPSTADLQWPAYDLKARPTMVFGQRSHAENSPRDKMRKIVILLEERKS
jgi:para-nitrobenzyl esterase